ncbi:GNAT family N-acetyltransferase [Leptolyngbya sp. 15MV]|nr:GNAT family N-acetyltransferase [Leptolyngbya sp. 15MV]
MATRASDGNVDPIQIRAASLSDADAVGALLLASYTVLLAPGYEPEVLARALPRMTTANAALLSSSTWYVAEASGDDRVLAGCGGWTLQRPSAPDEPSDPALGHLRHFAVHPASACGGIGRALFDLCVSDARAASVRAFECYATTVAERCYRALGLETVGPITVTLCGDIAFASLRMACQIAWRRQARRDLPVAHNHGSSGTSEATSSTAMARLNARRERRVRSTMPAPTPTIVQNATEGSVTRNTMPASSAACVTKPAPVAVM